MRVFEDIRRVVLDGRGFLFVCKVVGEIVRVGSLGWMVLFVFILLWIFGKGIDFFEFFLFVDIVMVIRVRLKMKWDDMREVFDRCVF